MAVTGQLWMSGLGFLCCDVIGKPMMGRTWIGWTTTIMISLGKISAKAKTTMKTGIYHQWVLLKCWIENELFLLNIIYVWGEPLSSVLGAERVRVLKDIIIIIITILNTTTNHHHHYHHDHRQHHLFPQLWELSASELDTARPEWQPGQVRAFLQFL